jgi:predicted Rossmann fold flavoprotein
VKKIAIIGGGASGLFAALHAAKEAKSDYHIEIFEGQDRVGKKLAITGSSMCNVTNDEPFDAMVKRYHDKEEPIRKVLSTFTVEETKKYFKSIHLPLVTREDGKVFPASFRAKDVIQALVNECKKYSIIISTQMRIKAIQKESDGFSLYCGEKIFSSFDAVILATGGFTFPNTGSKGDGYLLAQSMGHTIEPLRVGLSGTTIEDNALHQLSGLTLENVTIQLPNRELRKGSLLITHEGLSGPVIINNSRYLPIKGELSLNYINVSGKEAQKKITSLCNENGSKMFVTILHSFNLPSSFIDYLIEKNGIDGRRKAAEIGKKSIIAIATSLTKDTYKISLEKMENKAMVSAGGISLEEISLQTMESTIVPSLYFCGELLDIDGETGGYNLQFAFSSGAIAGTSCIKQLS